MKKNLCLNNYCRNMVPTLEKDKRKNHAFYSNDNTKMNGVFMYPVGRGSGLSQVVRFSM